MNILVAGGAGFIGSHLVGRLLLAGHAVTVLDNFSTGRNANLSALQHVKSLRVVKCDIVEGLPEIGGVDRIFHLASPASPPGYQRLPVETLRVNSEGTRHLLNLAERSGAGFLYASTSEAYGDPTEHPQAETYRGNVSSTGPRSMYDEAKRYGEALTMAYVRSRDVDGRIVRIFNTYGPHSDPCDGRLVPNFIMQALRREPLTIYADGRQTRSLCYVSDLVDGLILAMDASASRSEVINLGNPEERTILEFAETICRLTGAEPSFEFGPPAVEDDPQRRRPDISKARRLLNWEPRVTLEAGLVHTIHYFQTQLTNTRRPTEPLLAE
jgi:nucleoside-diphosphate-sugar epimerase